MSTHPELAELVENHLSRGAAQDVGLAAVVGGLGALATAFGEVQGGKCNWAAVLELLRRGQRDARAGLQLGERDARVAALKPYIDRQLAFASLLCDEIVRVTAGESTLR